MCSTITCWISHPQREAHAAARIETQTRRVALNCICCSRHFHEAADFLFARLMYTHAQQRAAVTWRSWHRAASICTYTEIDKSSPAGFGEILKATCKRGERPQTGTKFQQSKSFLYTVKDPNIVHVVPPCFLNIFIQNPKPSTQRCTNSNRFSVKKWKPTTPPANSNSIRRRVSRTAYA